MSHISVNRMLAELFHNGTGLLFLSIYTQTLDILVMIVIITTESSSLNSYVRGRGSAFVSSRPLN